MYQVASWKTQNKIANISHILAFQNNSNYQPIFHQSVYSFLWNVRFITFLRNKKSVLNLVCQITPQKCKQSRKYVTMLHNQGKLRKTTCDFCWNLRCRKTLNNYCNLRSNRISDMPFIDRQNVSSIFTSSNLKFNNQHNFQK